MEKFKFQSLIWIHLFIYLFIFRQTLVISYSANSLPIFDVSLLLKINQINVHAKSGILNGYIGNKLVYGNVKHFDKN